MLLDEVANLGAQADTMVTSVEDHSRQLGELSVMMQTVQEMMGAQQAQLMCLQGELHSWEDQLVVRETTVNECLLWLQSQVEAMDVDKDMDKETEGETLVDEATTVMEVDKGSPVVLDSDIDDFGSPELEPVPERRGVMGSQVDWLVLIEEEALTEVDELVLHGIPVIS